MYLFDCIFQVQLQVGQSNGVSTPKSFIIFFIFKIQADEVMNFFNHIFYEMLKQNALNFSKSMFQMENRLDWQRYSLIH